MPPVLRVRVIPRARSNTLTHDPSGTLRARLTAPPVEGAANRALVELLASRLGLKRGDLEVVQGARGRDKLVAVHGCSEDELAVRLRALAASDVDNGGCGD
jgi:uncharacterized protein YggU (UPF0235/DUF167 family)